MSRAAGDRRSIVAAMDAIDAVRAALADGRPGLDGARALMAALEAHAPTMDLPRFAGARANLARAGAALGRGNAHMALRQLDAVRRVVRLGANDEPVAEGTMVCVTRTRHGWHDGRLEGRVTVRSRDTLGRWSYVVTDAAGEPHEVEHTRDLRPLR